MGVLAPPLPKGPRVVGTMEQSVPWNGAVVHLRAGMKPEDVQTQVSDSECGVLSVWSV